MAVPRRWQGISSCRVRSWNHRSDMPRNSASSLTVHKACWAVCVGWRRTSWVVPFGRCPMFVFTGHDRAVPDPNFLPLSIYYPPSIVNRKGVLTAFMAACIF